ncbi:hypothetical protein ILUMI_26121 [Ignelater luminosus]|uniref:Fucosyltransferase n=1 Tax=Ignelater luminosus TaxID=2038154 RepID=A0A8K0C735_IGNLU|nr:hypothetical protein ILUMI_26121 [Ignelater luminosus]
MHLIRRAFIVILLFCTVFLLYEYIYKLQITERLENEESVNGSNTKYVLYWSPFMNNRWDYEWGFGYEAFEDCEYKDCFTTNSRTFMPLEKFDALIFHASYSVVQSQYGVPHIRSPDQIYVYMNLESPRWTEWKLVSFKSFFNWTMTYRLDSDIISQYGYLYKKKNNYFSMPSKEQLKNKTGAAWLVSHCDTDTKREILVRELQKFYKVDVYGSCGNLTCSRKTSRQCYEMIERKYKFYLSFENSYCKDYVTEKLFNVLLLNVVPIVYSAGINENVVPPKSIINIADFKNAGHLADYLKYLDDNVDEYVKYLEWKKDYSIRTERRIAACRLCEKLHQPLKRSVYEDISGWWFGKNYTMCQTGKKLPKIVSELLK